MKRLILLIVCIFASGFAQDSSLPTPYNELTELLPFNGFGWYRNDAYLKRLIIERKVQTVIEVGSFLGLSTRHIATHLPEKGIVYAIDHWQGSIEHQQGEAAYVIPIDQLYHQFLSNVVHAGLTHKIIPIRMDSLAAAAELAITADLIYIDASHDTNSVYQDLNAWYPHLNKGGILAGDDWLHEPVRRGAYQFLQQHPELSLYHSDNFYFFLSYVWGNNNHTAR